MSTITDSGAVGRGVLAIVAAALLGGCVFIPPQRTPGPAVPAPVEEPSPESPPAAAAPAPATAGAPSRARPAPPPRGYDVALVVDGASTEHSRVARELEALLVRDGHRVTLV